MSLSRKMLEAMGLEAEKVQSIIEAHTETVDGLKEKIAEYKEAAEKLPGIQADLAEKTKALEELKANGGDWEKKYNSEHEAFEKFKSEQEAGKIKAEKAAAYKNLLKDAGIAEASADAIIKVTDLEKVEIEDGKIKDAEAVTETVKKEWAGFIPTTETHGAGTDTPPAGQPAASDLEKLSMEEYIKARSK